MRSKKEKGPSAFNRCYEILDTEGQNKQDKGLRETFQYVNGQSKDHNEYWKILKGSAQLSLRNKSSVIGRRTERYRVVLKVKQGAH